MYDLTAADTAGRLELRGIDVTSVVVVGEGDTETAFLIADIVGFTLAFTEALGILDGEVEATGDGLLEAATLVEELAEGKLELSKDPDGKAISRACALVVIMKYENNNNRINILLVIYSYN